MDGKYNVILNTPMGSEKGIISFKTNGNILSGVINAKGVNNQFTNGRVNGNNFEFSGEIRIMMMKVPYIATGMVNGNTITATVKTNFGNFAVTGAKI